MSYLLEPLEGIGGEVVPLRMGQDVLGQGRENSLEIGTLGGRSHIGAIGGTYRTQAKPPGTQRIIIDFPAEGPPFALFALFALFAPPAVAARPTCVYLGFLDEQRCAEIQLECSIQALRRLSAV